MNPLPRRIGWALMALALAIGWGAREFGVAYYGPFPAVAVALLVGGIGVMLVFADMMVRGLYGEIGRSAARSEPAGAGDGLVRADADDVAVGGDLDRP
jgi:NADH:ubiquinone oxidoreductase subunit 6 (subunit J)